MQALLTITPLYVVTTCGGTGIGVSSCAFQETQDYPVDYYVNIYESFHLKHGNVEPYLKCK